MSESVFGPEYLKIQTVFKRDERNVIIPGDWSTDEMAYLVALVKELRRTAKARYDNSKYAEAKEQVGDAIVYASDAALFARAAEALERVPAIPASDAACTMLHVIRNDDDNMGLVRENDPYKGLVATVGQIRAAIADAAAVSGPTREELACFFFERGDHGGVSWEQAQKYAADAARYARPWVIAISNAYADADALSARFGPAICKETTVTRYVDSNARPIQVPAETTGLGSRADATVANQYRQIDLEYAHQVIADLRDDAATERHEAASYRENGHEGRARKHDVQATDYERSAEAIERILSASSPCPEEGERP
jgi:hypothetical protein